MTVTGHSLVRFRFFLVHVTDISNTSHNPKLLTELQVLEADHEHSLSRSQKFITLHRGLAMIHPALTQMELAQDENNPRPDLK